MQTQKTWTLLDGASPAGSSVLRSFFMSPPAGIRLNIQVPSREKLLAEFPILRDGARDIAMPVRIVEGGATDATMLDRCLKDSQVIILPCGPADTRMSRQRHADLARAIISGLRRLREQKSNDSAAAAATDTTTAGCCCSWQPPSVIQLRSSVQPTWSPEEATAQQQQERWYPRMLLHKVASLRRSSTIGGGSRRSRRHSAEAVLTKAAMEGPEKGSTLMRHSFVDISGPDGETRERGNKRRGGLPTTPSSASSIRSRFSLRRRKRKHEVVEIDEEDADAGALGLLGDEVPTAKKAFYKRLSRASAFSTATTIEEPQEPQEPKDHRWSVLVSNDRLYVPAKPKPAPVPVRPIKSIEGLEDVEEDRMKRLSRKFLPCLIGGMCYVGMAVGALPVGIPDQVRAY
ncbi:hypothetical protein LQW54_013111 [Pestalotiopsis sp. IQ-011]